LPLFGTQRATFRFARLRQLNSERIARMATPEKLVQPIPVEKAPSKIWEAEKDEARRIQESLLPTGSLRGPSFEVACRFSPFSEVSGDFADYFDLPNGSWEFISAMSSAKACRPRCTARW
jgi:hypothetical protein